MNKEMMMTDSDKKQLGKELIQSSWGTEEISSKDGTRPLLSLMQGSSDFVKEGKHGLGDIVHSISSEKIAGKDKKVEVIFFDHFKHWQVQINQKNGGKPIFKENIDFISGIKRNYENEYSIDLPNGDKEVRLKCMDFYTLFVAEPGLPVLIIFRSGSGKMASKKLGNFGKMCQYLKVPLASKTFFLSSGLTKNKDGLTFFEYVLEDGRKSTEAEVTEAKKWFDIIKKTSSVSTLDNTDVVDL